MIRDMSYFPSFEFNLISSEHDPTLLLPAYRNLPRTISTTEERPEMTCFCCRIRDQQLNKYNCIQLVHLFMLILLRRANKSVITSVQKLSFIWRKFTTLCHGTTFSVYVIQNGKLSKSSIFSLRRGCLWIDPKGENLFTQYFSPHYEATGLRQPQPLRQELNLIGDNSSSQCDDPDRRRFYLMSCSRNSLYY
jgi:hypothetical protein